jgi:hypothetical protein
MTAVKTAGLENLKTEIDKLAEIVHTEHLSAGNSIIQDEFETIRDASVFYYSEGSESALINNPYHDLYSFCKGLTASTDLTSGIKVQAQTVLNTLSAAVAAAYGDGNSLDLAYYETSDASAVRGLSIFIPHGEQEKDFPVVGGGTAYASFYAVDRWYISDTLDDETPPGGIDFCTYDNDGNVKTWRELFEAWYDEDGYTQGNY